MYDSYSFFQLKVTKQKTSPLLFRWTSKWFFSILISNEYYGVGCPEGSATCSEACIRASHHVWNSAKIW